MRKVSKQSLPKGQIFAIAVPTKVTLMSLALDFTSVELHDDIPNCNSNLNSRGQYLGRKEKQLKRNGDLKAS